MFQIGQRVRVDVPRIDPHPAEVYDGQVVGVWDDTVKVRRDGGGEYSVDSVWLTAAVEVEPTFEQFFALAARGCLTPRADDPAMLDQPASAAKRAALTQTLRAAIADARRGRGPGGPADLALDHCATIVGR